MIERKVWKAGGVWFWALYVDGRCVVFGSALTEARAWRAVNMAAAEEGCVQV